MNSGSALLIVDNKQFIPKLSVHTLQYDLRVRSFLWNTIRKKSKTYFYSMNSFAFSSKSWLQDHKWNQKDYWKILINKWSFDTDRVYLASSSQEIEFKHNNINYHKTMEHLSKWNNQHTIIQYLLVERENSHISTFAVAIFATCRVVTQTSMRTFTTKTGVGNWYIPRPRKTNWKTHRQSTRSLFVWEIFADGGGAECRLFSDVYWDFYRDLVVALKRL